jgi:5-hydroxyisourate hydrolase
MSGVSPITTHVLDIALGRPAQGVAITLDVKEGAEWRRIGAGVTDADGRLKTLLAPGALAQATYRITFDTGAYYGGKGSKTFYPEAAIVFAIDDATQHYHVPLLVSPFGYSTYRGS